MSITVDARATGGTGAGVASLTWNHTVGSLTNGILTVESTSADAANGKASTVQWDAAGTPVSLTNLGQKNDSAAQSWAEIWYLKAPASGTKQVKITFTGTLSTAQSGSASYDGVDQTTPWNAASPQSTNGTAPTQPSLTVTTAAGEQVVDALVDNESAGADTLVPGGSQNTIFNTTQAGNDAGGASDKAAAGTSTSISWSGVGSGSPWAYIAGSMRPASATGGGWVGSGTLRAPGQRGPFTQRGFLKSPFQTYSYVPGVTLNFYTLTATLGTFAETGVAANLLEGHLVTATVGTFALTGKAANLLEGHVVTATKGTFSESGIAAALIEGHLLGASTGIFALAGVAANLIRSRLFASAQGAFALNGVTAAFALGHGVTADLGTFTLSGQDVVLKAPYRLTADVGSVALAGQNASLIAQQAQPERSQFGGAHITWLSPAIVPKQHYSLKAGSGALRVYGGAVPIHVGRSLRVDTNRLRVRGARVPLRPVQWDDAELVAVITLLAA